MLLASALDQSTHPRSIGAEFAAALGTSWWKAGNLIIFSGDFDQSGLLFDAQRLNWCLKISACVNTGPPSPLLISWEEKHATIRSNAGMELLGVCCLYAKQPKI